MRTYGRVRVAGVLKWVEISPDTGWSVDYIWLTTFIQCLLLNLNESPFWANYGIPAQPSIVQQVLPDFYVNRMQQAFAQYFASLIVSRQSTNTPSYKINVTLKSGVKLVAAVDTPT